MADSGWYNCSILLIDLTAIPSCFVDELRSNVTACLSLDTEYRVCTPFETLNKSAIDMKNELLEIAIKKESYK